MPPATVTAPTPAQRRRIPSPGLRRVAVRRVAQPVPARPSHPSALVAEIAACAAETREANWDGYGAEPIATAVSSRARRLADMLPPALPLPEVAPAPSGSIDLEWRARCGDCISLCVYESGPVQYDGRIGGAEVAGSFPLAEPIPERVSTLLRIVAG